MPIASYTPNTGAVIVPKVDQTPGVEITKIPITDPKVDIGVVDLKTDPFPSMLAGISGARWAVDYHSQVITKDQEISGLQLTGASPYQSYRMIKDMVLRVTSPLSTVQDDTGKTMKVSGSAMLLGYVIPNDGDMFLADVGQNQLALFRVTSTVKKSIFKESVYEIGYDLDTTDPVKIAALATKVVQTLHYNDDWITVGKNPIVSSDDWKALQQLQRIYPKMLKEYFARFFSREYSTFLLPGQTTTMYDHYLTRFMVSLASSELAPEYHHVKLLNGDEYDVMTAGSLWDAVLQQDPTLLTHGFTRVGQATANVFSMNPYASGLAWSGVAYVIMPADWEGTVDVQAGYSGKVVPQSLALTPSFPTGVPLDANRFVYTENTRGTAAVSSIPAVTEDDWYILTSLFYHKSNEMSLFEKTIWSYLNRYPIDTMQLVDLAQLYPKWGILEQFYYVPLVMALMKAKLNGL